MVTPASSLTVTEQRIESPGVAMLGKLKQG